MSWVNHEFVKRALLLDIRPAAKKMTLVAIVSFASKTGAIYPSVARIARRAGANEKTVEVHLAALIQEGRIVDTGERVGKTKRIKKYKFVELTAPKCKGTEEKRTSNGGVLPNSTGTENEGIGRANTPKVGGVHPPKVEETNPPEINPTNDTKVGAIEFPHIRGAEESNAPKEKTSTDQAPDDDFFDLTKETNRELVKGMVRQALKGTPVRSIGAYVATSLGVKHVPQRVVECYKAAIDVTLTAENTRAHRLQEAAEAYSRANKEIDDLTHRANEIKRELSRVAWDIDNPPRLYAEVEQKHPGTIARMWLRDGIPLCAEDRVALEAEHKRILARIEELALIRTNASALRRAITAEAPMGDCARSAR